VSSILEALRELEASKSPAAPPTGAWTEEQSRSRTWLETIGIIAGGLAIGAAAFAFILWLSGLGFRGTAPSPGTAVPGSDAAPPAAPAPSGGRTLVVSSTGYSLPGHASTGMPVGHGVVAVDPAVIPLGTRLSIPGYGEGVAADTGGAVHGAVIDLWFPTDAQARAWGRRTVTVALH
jgi:3D (Asp-Asp-Asp) domain-containing protein